MVNRLWEVASAALWAALFWAVPPRVARMLRDRAHRSVVLPLTASIAATSTLSATLSAPLGPTFSVRLPPQRTGPWAPGGHRPVMPLTPGNDTCAICGETGVADFTAHIAEAWTRQQRSA